MAAMASKFNFECVIQYYTDQWILPGSYRSSIYRVHWFTMVQNCFERCHLKAHFPCFRMLY